MVITVLVCVFMFLLGAIIGGRFVIVWERAYWTDVINDKNERHASVVNGLEDRAMQWKRQFILTSDTLSDIRKRLEALTKAYDN